MTARFLLSDKPPDRKWLQRGFQLLRWGQYSAAFFFLGSVLLIFPKGQIFILEIFWFLVFLLYWSVRWILSKKNHWLMKEPGVIYHGAFGVLYVVMVYISFRYAGYGIYESDPCRIWMLMLIPLVLVSRYGTTGHWKILVTAIIAFSLIVRFGLLFYETGSFWLNQPAIVSILGETVIISGFSAIFHYIFRIRRMWQIRWKVVTEVSHKLASEVIPGSDYVSAAEAIHRLAQFPSDSFPRVFILKWDDHEEKLKVIGGAGIPKSEWGNIEIQTEDSVTMRAFKSCKVINEPDVKNIKKGYYCPSGCDDINSELAVPIIYQGKCLGVLDVESPNKNVFNKNDESLLQVLASGLGISLGNAKSLDQRVANSYELIRQTLAAGEENDKLNAWFEVIGNAFCEYFSADCLLLMKLSPGLRYPLKPALVWPKLENLTYLKLGTIPVDSFFWDLILDWQTVFGIENYVENIKENEAWISPFLERTAISSLAFVPIGLYEPIGGLFIGYKEHKEFGDVDRLALVSFAAAIERSYRQVNPEHSESERRGAVIHDIFIPSELGIKGKLEKINTNLNNPELIKACIIEIDEEIQNLHQRIILASAGIGVRYKPLEESLRDALFKVASGLKASYSRFIFINVNVGEEIENLPFSFLELLFSVASEGMGNSVRHGKADNIDVRIEKVDNQVELEIIDDGVGLAPNHNRNQPHGIYYWKRFIKNEYGMNLLLQDREVGGVLLKVGFPCIPVK